MYIQKYAYLCISYLTVSKNYFITLLSHIIPLYRYFYVFGHRYSLAEPNNSCLKRLKHSFCCDIKFLNNS